MLCHCCICRWHCCIGASPAQPQPKAASPALCWEMSQFWQKTHLRLHILKNTVPLPLQPCRGASSAKWGATVLTRAFRPTLHTPCSSCSLQQHSDSGLTKLTLMLSSLVQTAFNSLRKYPSCPHYAAEGTCDMLNNALHSMVVPMSVYAILAC